MANGKMAKNPLVNTQDRVYLDHAATSWPKLPGVIETATDYLINNGASAGRGNYRRSIEASQAIRSTKTKLANVFGCSIDEIAFTTNGTLALHAAMAGLFADDDHVVTTAIEHNSVLRPLARRDARTNQGRGDSFDIAQCDSRGFVPVEQIEQQLIHESRWIVISHASNVTGCLQDLKSIGDVAKQCGCHLIIDACQTAGIVDCSAILNTVPNLAAIATSGHKGLGGIFGTGVVIIASEFQERFRSPWIGGTGSFSESTSGDFSWSESIESGNKNVPAILSLGAAISAKPSQPSQRLASLHERLISIIDSSQLLDRVGPQLSPTDDAANYQSTVSSIPVVSTTTKVISPSDFAAILDSEYGIEARAGFHCSGMIHDCLGTKNGGTLRFSLGETSTESDLNQLESALTDIEDKM